MGGFLSLVFVYSVELGFRGGGNTRELLGRWSEILRLGWRVGGGGCLMNFSDGGPKIF